MSAEERLIRRVIARFRCSHCRRPHALGKVGIMGKYEDIWIVGVDCECAVPDLYAVSMHRDSSMERPSDLTDQERERFEAAARVGEADVEDIRAFLRSFDGDFSRMFGKAS
ncbi:MAG: hypothetical protein KGJ86_09340 [Chloroflexota bacterium]|nr:hypothetical protein [Chloroflexota bacterium]